MKKLHQTQSEILDQTFLHQCQIRPLLSTDRHLLNPNFTCKSNVFIHINDRITRTGTFNNQHQINREFILKKIRNGFFCLICSIDENNDLCSTCQILSQFVDNPSLAIPQIYVGELNAKNQTIIDYIYGKQSEEIRNSCFCNRYLLELSNQKPINQIFESIQTLSTEEIIPSEELEKLQEFTRNYQINVRLVKLSN